MNRYEHCPAGLALRPLRAHLLSSPTPETNALQPEVFQQGLHRAVAALFADAARERPLAVVIEDLQWLDAPSLALTTDVVRLCADAPVLVHLTARPESRPTAQAPCRSALRAAACSSTSGLWGRSLSPRS